MYYFIINPASSSGQGGKIWESLRQRLDGENIAYQSYFLSKPGDAAAIARRITAEDPYAVLAAVGGDGTINETVNGICSPETVTFACIPTGSGNDFCRGLRLTRDPMEALDRILHPSHIAQINIGLVSSGNKEQRFLVSAGIGFDAQVCYEVGRSRMKRILNWFSLGKMVYTAVAIKLLFTMRQPHIRIRQDDDRIEDFPKAYFAAFMNLPYEGGGYLFAPDADPSDNQLDVCAASRMSRLKVLVSLPLAMAGKHTGLKGVRILSGGKFQVQSSVPLCVHCDGEHFGFAEKLLVQPCKEKLSVITG